ncbi:UbiD family decarboxylase [Sediminispirochaeta smaragdinae DSM 11293]|uniref:UbiD family decarboxylase n=2 Tax=Sediminispirochaeta TaxID=1911556 RepID=E1R9H3_SEDSS|nr:UbiD family decarboxylase [Sediminispirochaeta smaragdinae DSM 11293]
MAYKGLQDFISTLEKQGELKRVSAEVDPHLEISEIYDRVVKAQGPALLFEHPRGSEFPVAINLFGSMKRMALALGVDSIDRLEETMNKIFDLSHYRNPLEAVRSLPDLSRFAAVFPLGSATASCQAVEEEPDLDKLPVLTCWPGDAGRFLTLPLVITMDPDTGQQNMGMYRMQVFDKTTTGMHWHLHKDGRMLWEKYRTRGEKMPVSVALGCDPAIIYAATAPLPLGIDELAFAGFLRRLPVTTTKCRSNDIRVPSGAEFILEGYVDPAEPLRTEGPFGDHTGYYSLADRYPVFHLERMTRRKHPVYPATVVGKPPMEDCFIGKATERLFLPLIKLQLPEIVDISFPFEGVFHGCVIVSIKKRYPGHAGKVMNALWGMGQMMYTKMIVVVDKDVRPDDYSTVAWKVFNNIDASRDLVLSKGPLDALDHSSPLPHYGTRLGIDATKTLPEEGHDRLWPDEITMSEDIRALVNQRWKEYGI